MFWAGPFELKFREFLGFWSSRIYPEISGNFWGFGAPGDFRFFPGNYAVSVFPGISNCIFVDLRDLR